MEVRAAPQRPALDPTHPYAIRQPPVRPVTVSSRAIYRRALALALTGPPYTQTAECHMYVLKSVFKLVITNLRGRRNRVP